MIKIHHDINLFNTQGLEKLNDFCTQYYHFSTNKNNEKKKYLSQLFKKQSRIEFFYLNGEMSEFNFRLNEDDDDDDDLISESLDSD